MDFYLRLLADERPEALMLSGGEPVLYPGIIPFLREATRLAGHVYLYTSFQYPPAAVALLAGAALPADRLTYVHSVFDFLPANWLAGTGFPHEAYVANLRGARAWPGRKLVKFVLNHAHLADEVALFRELVDPDEGYLLEGKLLNNQSNDWGKAQLARTRETVFRNLDLLPTSEKNTAQLGILRADGAVGDCLFWREPELRFAVHRAEPDLVLKYRFCGYFPPDFAYKLHVDAYKPGMFEGAFRKGRFREACARCRLLLYGDAAEAED